MKALIKVGYGCNENCTFCHTADIRHLDDAADRITWKIARAKRLGYTMVVLSGGEPTIRPELLGWARKVAALGLDFGLVTNGLMLSYPEIVDDLIDRCRLRYVYMSLHGGSAKVHGSVVRADTFASAMAALTLIAGRIPDLTVNCVVTTANVEHLRGVVEKLLPLAGNDGGLTRGAAPRSAPHTPGLTLKFSMTQPKGAANRVFDVIVPDVEVCADRVKDAITYGMAEAKARGATLRFAHDGLPFCLLPGLADLYDDLKTHRFAAMIEADEDDFIPVDDVAKVFPPKCGPCSLRGACPGLYKGYHETRGDSALRPVLGRPRSNSYHFTPERDIPRERGAPCPLLGDGVTPYDRARTLFVRLKDRLRLFRTETRDFPDVDLLTTKETLGQVYLDISRKLAPDDFPKDLRKLRLSDECQGCSSRPRCTGAWEPMPLDVFTRDDRRVGEILAGLSGRVLDLGCGDGWYLEALERRCEAGLIDYLGLDPDQERLTILAGRYPKLRFLNARAEDAPEDHIGPVDHVLALRSYNHLEDPDRALRRAVALLRPGGSLTLVDNVAFGLVRSRAAAARAEASTTIGFEHYRNDGAGEAAARLAGLPLRLKERRDVGPGTSNQWLLCYERAEELVS